MTDLQVTTELLTPTPARAPAALDAAFLMRFSALTYNAHRIRYDVDYSRLVEGNADLVVHGPLQALLMAGHLGDEGRPTRHCFTYRLVAPLCRGQGLRVSDGLITDDSGRVTAKCSWDHAPSGLSPEARKPQSEGTRQAKSKL